jgi:hypothetical protein
VVSFIGVGTPKYPEKTINLTQVTDKLDHMIMYREHIVRTGYELIMLVVIGTGCTCICKSNCHTIIPTTHPIINK